MQNRDHYIDVVKGFAILGVIFIHTAFKSGSEYVPDYVRTLSLLVDVPIFFFVSGITSSGNIKKTFIRLVKLQISYMAFVVPLFLFIYFWKGAECNTLLHWFCHDYWDSYPFPVVMGSMWYLRVYIAVVLLGAVVLRYFPKRFIDLTIVLLLGVIVGFNVLLLNQLTKQVVFYLVIFLVGFRVKNLRPNRNFCITGFWILTGLLCIAVCYCLWKGKIIYLQDYKFPPSIKYMIASVPSLFVVLAFRGRGYFAEKSIFAQMGRDAIFYYFAQGISSSLLFKVVPHCMPLLDWYCLLPLMFCLNVALAIPLAYAVKRYDSAVWYSLRRLKRSLWK